MEPEQRQDSILTKFFLIIALTAFGTLACDPDGKANCDWTLEPEPTLKDKVQQGFIPVCARNRKTMKQDCRLQTTLEKAKEYSSKRFKYNDLEVESVGLPRTIKAISFCE